MIKKIIITAVLLLVNSVANAAIVSFEEPTGSLGRISYFEESGVVFNGAFNHVEKAPKGSSVSSESFMQYRWYSKLNFGMADGSAFDLISIDLAELSQRSAKPITVTFFGQRADSVTVSQTFTTDGLFCVDNHGFQTFNFSDEFRGLETVYLADASLKTNGYFAFDNVNVSAVPLPAAVWLFIVGLISLFGFSRRQAIF